MNGLHQRQREFDGINDLVALNRVVSSLFLEGLSLLDASHRCGADGLLRDELGQLFLIADGLGALRNLQFSGKEIVISERLSGRPGAHASTNERLPDLRMSIALAVVIA
ncbi:hypothetical protein D3C87_1536630 [compost metagenome]